MDPQLVIAAVVAPLGRVGQLLITGDKLPKRLVAGHIITTTLIGYASAGVVQALWTGIPTIMLHVVAIVVGLLTHDVAVRYLIRLLGVALPDVPDPQRDRKEGP